MSAAARDGDDVAMLRMFLIAVAAAAILPATADAAVSTTIIDDTLVVDGDAAADNLTLTGGIAALEILSGSQRIPVARDQFERVLVRTGAGADRVRVEAAAAVANLTIETGAGPDVVDAGPGAEVIDTGDDADLVQTGGGADTVALGAGDDTAVQGAGDDSDRIDGQAGLDTLRVLGTSEAEEFTLQALGNRGLISRDTSPARAELAAVDIVEVSAGHGADLVDIGDVGVSGVRRVDTDLGVGDGAPDAVAAQGSAANEFIGASASNDAVTVSGFASGLFLRIDGSRAADDKLTLFGGDGRDSMTANGTLGTLIGLTVDGGAGNDTITGSEAVDTLRGGPGIDLVIGRKGADAIDLGPDDDGLLWNSGDGDDKVAGGAGTDSLELRGANAADTATVFASAGRARVTGTLTVDADDVERLDVDTIGGADIVIVSDLAGTDLKTIQADVGSGDNASDGVVVSGTTGNDKIKVVGNTVSGLAATVTVAPAETRDRLSLSGLEGADTIDSAGVPATGIRILSDGGAGDDVVLGGPGDEVFIGGPGADVLFAGSGDNVAFGAAGDDVLRGEEGDDVLDGGSDDDILIGNAGDDVLLNGEVVFDQ
jgi:Ca2+-binding RTX toxin-like protein